VGRNTDFTEEAAAAICARLADGEPLRQICRDEAMPAWRTVYHWIDANPDFKARIARARDVGFDAIAEQCLDIADDSSRDETEPDEDGMTRVNTEVIQRSKLRVETRLKLLAKWSPKRYGDKMQQEISGPDGGAVPLVTTIRIVAGDGSTG